MSSSEAAGPALPAARASRVIAIDALRGFVMVLMTMDHASGAFNQGRVMKDGAFDWTPGTKLDTAQFIVRWATHLCAPTFVFLAGVSLFLSGRRRAPSWREDRFLFTRGLFIAALDPLWMSWGFEMHGKLLCQVLYAIGMSFVMMTLLRRLPWQALLAFALATIAGHEALVGFLGRPPENALGVLEAFVLTGGFVDPVIVAYPLLPWLGIMALGFVAGRFLVDRSPKDQVRAALAFGSLALALYAVLRGVDGYGNLGLHRDDGSLVQWLHVSKYPPSATFDLLELGIASLLYAGFVAASGRRGLGRLVEAFAVLGRTAFFFYLLHVQLLHGAAHLLGLDHKAGIGVTLLATAGAVAFLAPLCVAYGRLKARHPDSLLRYI